MGFKTRVVGKVAKALVEEGVLGGAMYENEIHEEMALHIFMILNLFTNEK